MGLGIIDALGITGVVIEIGHIRSRSYLHSKFHSLAQHGMETYCLELFCSEQMNLTVLQSHTCNGHKL